MKLTRTTIIATLGKPGGGKDRPLFNPKGVLTTAAIPHGEYLTWLMDAGVNIFRFNMSFAGKQAPGQPYGSNEKAYLDWLQAHQGTLARRIAVLGDLPGPKIRLSGIQADKKGLWKQGDKVVLYFDGQPYNSSNQQRASVLVNEQPFSSQVSQVGDYPDVVSFVNNTPSPVIFSVGDGKITLRSIAANMGTVICEVLQGGKVLENKGLTIKGARLKTEAFGDADKRALDFLLEHAGNLLAFVAISFVQSREDILAVKWYLRQRFSERKDHELPMVIAKIETPAAVEDIDRILDVADGIMVARGDLGEQLSPEMVPVVQKKLLSLCIVRGKPSITATQMLDSMERNPEPTRAEATDVFNAILDGSDAVMLSGETSAGVYPVQAVRTMQAIAWESERYLFQNHLRRSFERLLEVSHQLLPATTARFRHEIAEAAQAENDLSFSENKRNYYRWLEKLFGAKLSRNQKHAATDRISQAACALAEDGKYPAILAPTTSGRTAFLLSRFRPEVPIIAAAHSELTFRKLLLGSGIFPVNIGKMFQDLPSLLEATASAAQTEGLLPRSQEGKPLEVVATSGTPFGEPGTTNLIQIWRVNGEKS